MKRALVVSDDSLVREKLLKSLESLSFEVHSTTSVREALDYLGQSEDLSLVVTDRVFSQKEGEWLIHTIRKDERFRDVSIVVLDEYSGMKNIYNLLKIGVQAFIPKKLCDKYFKDYVCRHIQE